jgi:hypothetical protein
MQGEAVGLNFKRGPHQPSLGSFDYRGVRGKDLNVKVYKGRRTVSDDKSPHWPNEPNKFFNNGQHSSKFTQQVSLEY